MFSMKKVLIINDDQQLLHTLTTILQNDKYEVVTALGGKQGLQFIRHDTFDLVITDITMSYCSGFEIIAEIRENSFVEKTFIVVLSSIRNQSTITECLDFGVDAYIQKPFVPKSFMYSIKQILTVKAYAYSS